MFQNINKYIGWVLGTQFTAADQAMDHSAVDKLAWDDGPMSGRTVSRTVHDPLLCTLDPVLILEPGMSVMRLWGVQARNFHQIIGGGGLDEQNLSFTI